MVTCYSVVEVDVPKGHLPIKDIIGGVAQVFDLVNRLSEDGTTLIPVCPSKDKSQKPCITVKSKIIQPWASFATYVAIMQDLDTMANTNWSNRPKTLQATIKLVGTTKEDLRYAIVNA